MLKNSRILSLMLLFLGMAASACHALDGVLDPDVNEQLDPYRTAGSGWTYTSSGYSGLGRPATLTWSMAPDGTGLPGGLGEPRSPSNLIAFLDGVHHDGASPGGADLTQRDWFPLVESSFERWDAVSGVNFNYEPNDDGAVFSSSRRGILGTRGDHRIGGHSIDGQISPTFLAYNFFPNYAEMVIDTDEINRWSNPEGNFILFRNMLMHEAGHGLGINHLDSSDASFLMEPYIATEFDGPQLDDILAVHRLYGDANEENGGNDSYLNATPLGRIRPGESNSFGVDAVDTVVDFEATDFLSIDDNSDVDFFSFTVKTPSLVDLTLTPLGPAYQHAGYQTPYDTSAFSDLALTLLDSDGTSLLGFANGNGLGAGEEINEFQLDSRGEYFVKISGLQNAAQFYQLDITADFAFPHDPPGLSRANIFNIPEPSTGLLLFAGLALCGCRRLRR